MTRAPTDAGAEASAARVCALPGCGNVIPGNLSNQRYCSVRHRNTARKHRRTATLEASGPSEQDTTAGAASSSVSVGSPGPATDTPPVGVDLGPTTSAEDPALTRHGFRRLVPEPENRWYQRSAQAIRRGVRLLSSRQRRARRGRHEPRSWRSEDDPPPTSVWGHTSAEALPAPPQPQASPVMPGPAPAEPTPPLAPASATAAWPEPACP